MGLPAPYFADEGMCCIGIEREAEYAAIARERLSNATRQQQLFSVICQSCHAKHHGLGLTPTKEVMPHG